MKKNKKKKVLVEYELRIRAISTRDLIDEVLEQLERKGMRDSTAYELATVAYELATESANSFIGAKWNRDISHQPCEKENITKGF